MTTMTTMTRKTPTMTSTASTNPIGARRGLRRSAAITGALAASALFHATALAVVNDYSEKFTTVKTDHPNDGLGVGTGNGLVSLSGTGGPLLEYQVGQVRIAGVVEQSFGPPIAFIPAELRIRIERLNPQGFVIAFVDCWPLSTITSPTLGSIPIGPLAFDGSALGIVDFLNNPGDVRIRCFEQYDDTLGPVNVIDAFWDSLTVTFQRKVPAGPDLGVFVECPFDPMGPQKIIDTDGSDFATALGLYSSAGDLLAMTDSGGVPPGASFLSLDGLPPGEYYLCVSPSGAIFDDGFETVPSAASPGGALVVNHPSGSASARLHEDSVLWHVLTIVAAPCPSDINGDGVTDTADLGLLIGAFGTMCP